MDVRASYAMETHGVLQTRLKGAPGPGGLLDPPSGRLGFLQSNFFKALPVLLLLGVYGAVQFAQWLKVQSNGRVLGLCRGYKSYVSHHRW